MRAIYPEGIHAAVAEFLSQESDFSVSTATLDDPECGLTEETLQNTDVLIWWGHMKHASVPDEVAIRVQNAVLSGMGFIALHSAHHSKPFRRLMGTGADLGWREDGDRERLWQLDRNCPAVIIVGFIVSLGKHIGIRLRKIYVNRSRRDVFTAIHNPILAIIILTLTSASCKQAERQGQY